MKTLVVFYSRSGTTKKVAEAIAKELNADVEEIIDLKNRKGPIGWLASGRDAMKKKPADIQDIVKNPGNYDLVIVGSPLWAGAVTPAIRTYFMKNKNIKKVAFFCTMGGENPSKIFIQMEELSLNKPVSILALTTSEVNKGLYKDKLSNYIREIKKGMGNKK